MTSRENNETLGDCKCVTEPSVVKSRSNLCVRLCECRHCGALYQALHVISVVCFDYSSPRFFFSHRCLVSTPKCQSKRPAHSDNPRPPPLHLSPTTTDARSDEHDGTLCLAKCGKERCELSYVTVSYVTVSCVTVSYVTVSCVTVSPAVF